MNSRIRELADQAADEIANLFRPGFFDDRMVADVADINQKFAELIVRECMDIVQQEALLTDYVSAEMNGYAGKRLKDAFVKIEQHFGVEE